MKGKPTASELNAINLSAKLKLFNGHSDKQYFNLPAGKEHYRLLHWFGENFNTILEFGTYRGLSTLALSGKAMVHSYDIEDHDKAVWMYLVDANTFIYDGDYSYLHHDIDDFEIIFFDTVHDGKSELEFYTYLNEIGWTGILILDDIHWNKEMEDFWNSIELRKEDWTSIGHWSGTGIVFFE